MTVSDNRRLWIVGDVVQSPTPSAIPPADLMWTCEMCGPQPPIALFGNRWVKRQCACQREARNAEKQLQAAQLQTAQVGKQREEVMLPMTRLGQILPASSQPKMHPPVDLFWTCTVCGLIEPVALPSGRWIQRSCECERKARKQREQEEVRQAWMREQCVHTFRGWLGAKWVDHDMVRELRGRTFDTYDPTRQPDAYEKAYAFAQQPKGNLLFYGSYGTGKTHLEAAICNSLREVGRLLPDGRREPMRSLFVSAPQFFMAYDETKKVFDQTHHIRLIEMVMSAPVLIIDDIDKSRPKEERWEVYWLIFDARCTARRPTILSTNKKEELDLYIGEATLSRLSRGLVAVKMIGADYRQEEA